jgi:Flp pilus assembly protein TadD
LIEVLPNGYVPVVQSLIAQQKRVEAIELCLRISNGKPTAEMAILLANVLTATEKPLDSLPEAQAAIEAAMEDHGENIELLHAEAVRRASQGQYDDAIAVFRRVLTKDPDNVLALNNFATVLAETPNERGEALEHIQRAIEIAGRKASLLDTQGTILLKIGNTEKAIACLEEATAGGTVDARYYLHLAAAYHQAQRYEDAQRMLMESRAFGLEKFVLTADDRQLLAAFEEQFGSISASADKQL